MSVGKSGPRRRRGPRLDTEMVASDLRERLRALEGALGDLAGGEGAPPGFDPTRFLSPGVPRVRPLLVMLSARVAAHHDEPGEPAPDRDNAAAEHVAIAAELLHLAVVLQDAALGRGRGRRRRAARRLIGGAVGILGGNHLTLRALELVRNAPAPEIIGDLLEAMREIGDAHALAHSVRNRVPTSAEALALADGHSGSVFSFACRAGAHLGGADRPVVTALGRYGRHTGIAWHLAEDLAALDHTGDELVRALNDRAAEPRPHYTVCLAAERDPAIGRAWRALARDPDAEAATRLGEKLRSNGVFTQTREMFLKEAWCARRALSDLAPSRDRDALDRIVAELMT